MPFLSCRPYYGSMCLTTQAEFSVYILICFPEEKFSEFKILTVNYLVREKNAVIYYIDITRGKLREHTITHFKML